MPVEDKIKDAFSTIKNTGVFIDEDDFRQQLKANPKEVFDIFNQTDDTKGMFIDFEDFNQSLDVGKPQAAPLPGGGGGLSSDMTPGMDGGKQEFGIERIGQKIGKPELKTVVPYSEPKIEQPIKTKKSELVQDMIFKKDVLEYNKLNLEENQGRFNDTGLNLAVNVAQKAGRSGPDALNYAKRLQGAAVNQQAAGRIQKEVDDYQKSLLGDTGLQDIKNYNQSQLAHKESESLSKQAFAEKNKDLFPTVNKEEQFRKEYMAPFEKNANLSTKKLNPVVQSLSDKITQQFKESGGKDFVLSSDAGKVPDPEAINNYVEDKAYILGFGDDKLFKSYLKTQLQGAIEYALIEPEVNKKFQATPAYQKIEKEKVDAASKLMAIPVETKKAAESISEDINNQYKMAIEPLNNGYIEQQNNLKATYETSTAQITQQAAELNRLAQEGQIDQQFYEANINQLNVQSQQLFKDYNTQFEATNQAYLDEINKVNTKYNAQYRRRVQELTATNEAVYNRLKGEFDKMGLTPQDQVALQEAYKKSYQEAVKEKLGKEEERTFQTALLKRVVDRFSSGIGSTMRGFGETLNIPSLKLTGDQLLAKSYLSPIDYKKYREGIGSYLMESGAQLAGSMATSMGLTAAAVATTGGTIMPLIIGGLAGWTSESIEMAGNIGADVFEQTGSLKKAEDASAKSWETQIALMPLYALESAPFMKGFVKGKTILGRVTKGAVMEFVPELLQEYPQNIFEEAIKKGASPYEALGTEISNVFDGIRNLEMNPSVERVIQTAVDIGPVMILGGAGAAKDVYAEKREKFKVGKFVSKLTPADFANDAMSQFVYRTTAYKGKDFATAVATSLYSGGQIDKVQFDQMISQVQRATEMYAKAQQAGLSNPQFVVLSSLGAKSEDARRLAESEPQDSPLKAAMEAKARNLESMVQKYSSGEKVSVVVTVLPNGNQVINTLDEIKERLNNSEFASELLKGGIKFDVLQNEELTKELGDLIAETIDKTPAPIVQEVASETAPAVAEVKTEEVAPAVATTEEVEATVKEVGSLRDVELTMRRPEKNEIVFVPVDALLEKHAKDQPSYDITKPENRIKGRVEKAKEFIKNYIKDQRAINPKTGERMKSKVSFEPSVVDIDANGKISFEDGRHRVLAAKELGLTEVPIEVSKENAKAVESLLSKPAPQAEVAVGEEITTKTKPSEIKTETKEPAVLEGVRDGRTEAKGREVSPELRAEEEAKSPIAVEDFKVLEAKGNKGRDARVELKDRIGKDNYAKMDKINKQFDNISKDLEAKGLWKKICP